NNWSYFFNIYSGLVDRRDWFEPRVDGKFYLDPKGYGINLDFSTNYNKPLAFNFGGYGNKAPAISSTFTGGFVEPMIRINDHLSFSLRSDLSLADAARGFCTFDSLGDPVFGRRNVRTWTNLLTARYQFNPFTSLALRTRHYWSQGTYDRYYRLENDGGLTEINGTHGELPFDTDFNTNYFNIDLVFNWVFSPGSSLLLTYKSQIIGDNQDVSGGYVDNLRSTWGAPQTDSVALKLLYFLDYERVTHRRESR
ncbi:MAG: hypothetical protein RL021_1637, partial [Bacteroidota bacterium]